MQIAEFRGPMLMLCVHVRSRSPDGRVNSQPQEQPQITNILDFNISWWRIHYRNPSYGKGPKTYGKNFCRAFSDLAHGKNRSVKYCTANISLSCAVYRSVRQRSLPCALDGARRNKDVDGARTQTAPWVRSFVVRLGHAARQTSLTTHDAVVNN